METRNMKNRRYPYRIVAPIPYLPDGGVIPQYKPVDTSNVNLPQQTGGFKQNVGTMGTVGAAAAGILGTVAASGRQQNPYQANLAGNSATQQTVDSLVSLIPGVGQIYGAGKLVGQIAKNDYAAQNEFGELANTEKFNIADTIGTFIDPLSSFISGISGEGWTAQQRSKMINDKAAPQRKAYEEYQTAQLKQREVNAGLGGRYFDQNQLMQAEMGGPLNVGYYTDAVLGSSMQLGGPISKNYGMTRADLPQLSNYNAGTDIYEEGGALGQQPMQPMNPRPRITEYNEGGEHSENQSGYGGVPVDAQGNKAITSQNRPIAVTEEGEISFYSPSRKAAYVFSNKIYV